MSFIFIPSIAVLTLIGLLCVAIFAELIVMYMFVFFIGGALRGFGGKIKLVLRGGDTNRIHRL